MKKSVKISLRKLFEKGIYKTIFKNFSTKKSIEKWGNTISLKNSFKKSGIALIAFIYFFTCHAFPQNSTHNIEVIADVDVPTVLVGEDVTYTVTVKGANLPDNISPIVEGLDAPGLSLISTARQRTLLSGSSVTIIINGKTIKQDKNAEEIVQFTYILRPQRPGGFKIGPASVLVGGQTYKSNIVTFDVSTQPIAPTGVTGRAPVFLHAEISPKQLFVGESVVAKFYLFAEPDHEITDLGRYELPKFEGFMKTDIEPPNKYKVVQQFLGNKPYNTIYLGRILLFPIKAGKLTISSMKIEYLERQRAGTHPFFGPQYREYKDILESEPVTIEALPLPGEGKPINFSGAVGRFSMKVNLGNSNIKVGESVNLELTIEGIGNLESTNLPTLNFPPEFQSYPPEKQDQRSVISEEVHSVRTIKYILIPQKEGTYSLGPIEFSYFDPLEHSYKTLQMSVPTITVAPSAGNIPSTFSIKPYEDVQSLGKDIRYIKPDTDSLEDQSMLFYQTEWYLAIHVIPLFFLGGAVLLNRRKTKLKTDKAFSRRISALPSVRKKLKYAEDSARSGKYEEFYQQLSSAILNFIADMMNLKAAGLTSEEIKTKLRERGADEKIIKNITNLLNRCDECRYTLSSIHKEKMKEDLKETQNLIKALVPLLSVEKTKK